MLVLKIGLCVVLAGQYFKPTTGRGLADVARKATALLGLFAQIGGRHHGFTRKARRNAAGPELLLTRRPYK